MKRCKIGSRKTEVELLELPLHLIFYILSRLTIETIFSCKCVCKTFLHILSDPGFAQLHLKNAPNIEDGLIIQNGLKFLDILIVYKNSVELGTPNSHHAGFDSCPCQTLTIPSVVSHFYNFSVLIVGSCNGLVCLRYSPASFSKIYYICNPILGEFLALPKHIQYNTMEHVGFGFCPKTKQYKVVRFVTPSICTILTLGTDCCWRQIAGNAPPFPRGQCSFDSSLNGNLHWITKNTTTVSNIICSFNLENEQFSYLPPPPHFNQDALGPSCFYLKVGLLGGLFCFCYQVGDRFEAFVMKDYGVQESWAKKFSVDLSSIYNLQWASSVYVVRLLNNGDLLLGCDMYTLVCCNLWKGTTKYMLAEKNVFLFGVVSFVPSFISLKELGASAVGKVEVVQRRMRRNQWSENGFSDNGRQEYIARHVFPLCPSHPPMQMRYTWEACTSGPISKEQANSFVLPVAKFILECDAAQIRLALDKFISVCKRFHNYVELLEAPMRGVAPLLTAVKKLQSSPEHLTTLHADFLQLCLLSKCYKTGFRILEDDIFEVDQPKDLYLYCYYGGMICIGLKRYPKALELLHNVVTAPMSGLSAIAVEAYKKYILVSLIHLGQFSTTFPKYTSAAAQRGLKNFSQLYIELVSCYGNGKISELEVFIQANKDKFESDHNLGLAKQVLSSMYKRNIQRLTQTYLTLSLEDIAKIVELSSPREAEMHVLQMIQDGEIYAAINQKDGMVRFLEDPEQYKTCEMIERIDFSIQRMMRLSKKLSTVDELISCDSQYLGKAGKERQRFDFDDFDPVPQRFNI